MSTEITNNYIEEYTTQEKLQILADAASYLPDVSALKNAGAKPLMMALVLFIWLIVGGGAINLAVHSLMA